MRKEIIWETAVIHALAQYTPRTYKTRQVGHIQYKGWTKRDWFGASSAHPSGVFSQIPYSLDYLGQAKYHYNLGPAAQLRLTSLKRSDQCHTSAVIIAKVLQGALVFSLKHGSFKTTSKRLMSWLLDVHCSRSCNPWCWWLGNCISQKAFGHLPGIAW